MEGELWYDPSTWNWDPQCPPAPEGIKTFINATNSTNATIQIVTPDCTGYCAGFLYPLTWQIAEIREIVYPIFLYIFGILYTFFAIAIICDEFFVPALERIAEKYDISPDVAGATLMAAGGSAPELATSSIGTFNESPVGFGTIVGSAVFNVLFVIGACAFAAPRELKLDWWPLFRDSSFYCFSLLVVAFFFGLVSPSRIYWYESLILFSLYVVYVVLMAFNTKLEKKVNKLLKYCRKGQKKEDEDNNKKKTKKPSEIAVHPAPPDAKCGDEVTKKNDSEDSEDASDEEEKKKPVDIEKDGSDSEDDDDDDDDEVDPPFEIVWPTMEAYLEEDEDEEKEG